MESIDICIVGGGIVGLSIAKVLADKGFEGALIEESQYLGDATTGRNSGVLHGGIYYPTGSLKHRSCIRGNAIWSDWCQDLSLPIKRCGKYIVAETQDQVSRLEEIFLQAQSNEVPGIRRNTSQEMLPIEPFTKACESLYSPQTGILDVPAAVKAITNYIESRGFYVLRGQKVEGIDQIDNELKVRINGESFKARHLINCAGHGAIELRSQLGLEGLSADWVKGHYLRYQGPLKHPFLIYPIPEENDRGLGIHNVIEFDGSLKFGPDSETVNEFNYQMNPEAIGLMVQDVCRRFKGVKPHQLSSDMCGIRPKIVCESQPFRDFWLRGPDQLSIPGYIELCGIDSPGLTAAPALAMMVGEMLKSS